MPGPYTPHLTEYFWRPARPMAGTCQGAAGSVQGGTHVVFAADVQAGLIRKLGFRAFACPHIIAACHRLAEQLEGSPVEGLLAVRIDDLRAEFDIPVEKAGKLLILQDALRACYVDYQAAGERPAHN